MLNEDFDEDEIVYGENIAFKKPKLGDDLINDNVTVPGSRDTPMYLSADDLRSAVQDFPLLLLFQIKNTKQKFQLSASSKRKCASKSVNMTV